MQITVYTRTLCAYCGMVKRYLDSKGNEYNSINLDEHPELAEEVLRKSGALTVPVTVVTKGDTERIVIGYNLASLSQAIA